MDPIRNPFAPGAGTPPPELAGRDKLLATMHISIERTRRGLAAKSVVLVGLRGVGKTVLLDRMKNDAEEGGIRALRVEAPEGRSLPGMLAPQIRLALLGLSRIDKAKDLAGRGLQALAGFAKALKQKYDDIEVGFDAQPEAGLADNGDLEQDLLALLETTGLAARKAETALAIFIDEMQYVEEDELAALITALHRCSQRQLPIIMVGAGLPQIRGRLGRAKSYAERLFDFPEIGPLSPDEAESAIAKPAGAENVTVTRGALERIVLETHCFPYFVQEWGKQAWDAAEGSEITEADVSAASRIATAALDESFFRVRFDRLTPAERIYLRAMAARGPGPHRSGDVAAELGRDVRSLAPTRGKLISKGMAYSPGHGDTAFTVPLFDEFMKRIMPGEDWRS
jgi:hypothetical protein